jgi:ribosomal protein L35
MGTKLKTNKSASKRLKVTKNGKLVARKPGHNHFNARDTGSEGQSKKRATQILVKNNVSSRFLPKLK